MIKSSKGKSEISGTIAEILADYSAITFSLKQILEEKNHPIEMLEVAYKRGLESEAEFTKKIASCLKKILAATEEQGETE